MIASMTGAGNELLNSLYETSSIESISHSQDTRKTLESLLENNWLNVSKTTWKVRICSFGNLLAVLKSYSLTFIDEATAEASGSGAVSPVMSVFKSSSISDCDNISDKQHSPL